MLKVYIPLSLFAALLKFLGIIDAIAPLFSPIMGLMGLPGEAALTLLAGFTNSLYAALATMSALDLSFRQVTILGVVLGLAHSLFVETGILTKLRIATIKIAFFRIAMAFVTGVGLNIILPADAGGIVLHHFTSPGELTWSGVIVNTLVTSLQIVAIIFCVTAAGEAMAAWRYTVVIREKIRFLTRAAGLSPQALGPWLVGFFIGITYGAAMLFQFSENRRLAHKDACLVTVFLCLAHAIIEDTLLFVIVGGNFWWIILTRIVMAFAVVKLLSLGNLYRHFLWVGLPRERTASN